MKNTSLESFIEQYLANKKISDYRSWLSLYGTDTEKAYRSATAEADSRYRESLSTYGKTAELLREKGLSGSGYSDYLTGVAQKARTDEKEIALREKSEGEKKNYAGFLSFLEKAYENETKANKEEAEDAVDVEAIYNELLEMNILDRDLAFSYLESRGIDTKEADRLAGESVLLHKNNTARRREVLSTVISKRMEYPEAYRFAQAAGLSDDIASEIASIAAFTARYK